MKLTKIELIQYKSIKEPMTINFNEGLPLIFIGKNGSGKTNILEAIEAIAVSNANKYSWRKAKGLKYRIYFKFSKEELSNILPSIEYDETRNEVIAYCVDDEGLRINRLESEYIVPELKKVILDIRELTIALKSSIEIYEKLLYKISHDGIAESPVCCYEVEDSVGATINYHMLMSRVKYFIDDVSRTVSKMIEMFDSEDENALNFLTHSYFHFRTQDIFFKLAYKKPKLPVFEQKFITINESAIKREITKINKTTAKNCEEINSYISKINEQLKIIVNGLDLENVKRDEIDNKYFQFLRETQDIIAKKCIFLKNENNELLFLKQKDNEWYQGREYSLMNVYFKQVYQGDDKDDIIKKLSNGERLILSDNALKEFESYINNTLPDFEKDMFNKISVQQSENSKISIILHEKTGEQINLNETSSGRRWYFTYYIMKSILDKGDMFIIDEPASMLHPSAQKEILLDLEELAKNGVKVIYSTHSPYLISQEKENINFVTMTKNGTKLSSIRSNQELCSQMAEIVGEDIFDIQAIFDMYAQCDQVKLAKDCYNIIKAKEKDLNIAANNLLISVETIKSWNRKGDHFRCPKLENIISVCKYTNKKIHDLLK